MSETKNTAGYTFAAIFFVFLGLALALNGMCIAYSFDTALIASPTNIVTGLRALAWIGTGAVCAVTGAVCASLGALK